MYTLRRLIYVRVPVFTSDSVSRFSLACGISANKRKKEKGGREREREKITEENSFRRFISSMNFERR